MRKQWTRELDGLNTGAQIAHIRKILNDLGMVGRLSMEQAREIRAQRELAQELGAWLDLLSRGLKVDDISRSLDDVQKFERAVVSGKPFKTENTNRRLTKSGGGNVDTTNDSSGSESEEVSADREAPKTVSLQLAPRSINSDSVRITRGEVSWPSYRTKAPTTTEFYIPHFTF